MNEWKALIQELKLNVFYHDYCEKQKLFIFLIFSEHEHSLSFFYTCLSKFASSSWRKVKSFLLSALMPLRENIWSPGNINPGRWGFSIGINQSYVSIWSTTKKQDFILQAFFPSLYLLLPSSFLTCMHAQIVQRSDGNNIIMVQ